MPEEIKYWPQAPDSAKKSNAISGLNFEEEHRRIVSEIVKKVKDVAKQDAFLERISPKDERLTFAELEKRANEIRQQIEELEN